MSCYKFRHTNTLTHSITHSLQKTFLQIHSDKDKVENSIVGLIPDCTLAVMVWAVTCTAMYLSVTFMMRRCSLIRPTKPYSCRVIEKPVGQGCPRICRRSPFLRLGSTKGHKVFRETKMCNGGRILLAVLILYARIEMRVAAFHTFRFVTDSMQLPYFSIDNAHPKLF